MERPAPAATVKTAAAHIKKPAQSAKKPIRYETAGFAVKELSSKDYLYTQFNVITYYIALLAVPANQNLDYDFPISRTLLSTPPTKGQLNYPLPPPVVSLAILLVIIALAFYLAFRARAGGKGGERSRLASFAIFWFFIALSPTSSFIPIIDVFFEHRLYLASTGFFIVLVLLIDWVAGALSSLAASGRLSCDTPRDNRAGLLSGISSEGRGQGRREVASCVVRYILVLYRAFSDVEFYTDYRCLL